MVDASQCISNGASHSGKLHDWVSGDDAFQFFKGREGFRGENYVLLLVSFVLNTLAGLSIEGSRYRAKSRINFR